MSRSFRVGAATIEVGTEQYRAFQRTIDAALPTASRLIEDTTASIVGKARRGGMTTPPEPTIGDGWPVGRRRKPNSDRRYWVANSKRLLFRSTRISPPFVVEGVVGNSAPYAYTIRQPYPFNNRRVANELLVKPFRKGAKVIAKATAKDLSRT